MQIINRTAGPELHTLAGRTVYVRVPSQDDQAYAGVLRDNEYRLPDHFGSGDVILDVGANAGYFALGCLGRGAGKVYCVEPEKANVAILRSNLAGLPAHVRPCAIWRSDRREQVFLHNRGARLTAMHHTLHRGGDEVPSIGLDSLILIAAGAGEVRLLKLDCEGAEYPAVLTSKRLRQCREIVGELHYGYRPGLLPADWTPECFVARLRAEGFDVATWPHAVANCLSFFHARRRPLASACHRPAAKAQPGEALAQA